MGLLKSLRLDETGSTTVEFVFAAGALLLITMGTFDFGRIAFDWNAAQKATEVGVRMAIVRDPIPLPFKHHFACNPPLSRSLVGMSCRDNVGTLRPECNYGTATCTSTGCTVNGVKMTYTPGGVLSRQIHQDIVAAMQTALPRLQPENVDVTYRATDLGFIGMPAPVSEVTVLVRDVTFDFMGLAPFPGFANVTLAVPQASATMTAEDLSNNTCEEQGLLAAMSNGRPVCQKPTGTTIVAKPAPICFAGP